MPTRRLLTPSTEIELVRPLLFASREAIEGYARENGLAWREDASNLNVAYRRAALRRSVLPAIEEAFGSSVRERIADAAERMRGYLDSGEPVAADFALDAATPVEEGWAVPVEELLEMPEVGRHGVLLGALRRWLPSAPRSAAVARALDALLGAQPGRRVDGSWGTVWRDREHLVFDPVCPSAPDPVSASLGRTLTSAGELDIARQARPERFEASPCIEYVDADRAALPLTLRPWRAGDRIQPLGMDGHTKSVSDLLTDDRVPPQRRARQLVLMQGDVIVWVVGRRLGEPFRVRPETTNVLRLEWTPRKAVDGNHGAG